MFMKNKTVGQIMINTDVNARCPCEILGGRGFKRSILVQTDWDYPGFASSFGWTTRSVQRCRDCKKTRTVDPMDNGPFPEFFVCDDCEATEENKAQACCNHDGTDGTVDCKACGVTATDFISAAGEYLEDNDGKTAEDPGYFN